MTASEALALVVAALTAVMLVCGLVGLAVRYALLPWLREHIVTPVQETNRQVTVNQHVSPEPTLLDKIDTVSREVRTAAGMFEGHIERSGTEWGRIWDAIDELRTLHHNQKDPP